MAAAAPSVTVCRQLIKFTAVICLLNTAVHCEFVRADADASTGYLGRFRRTLRVENTHAWSYSKSAGADEKINSAAAGVTFPKRLGRSGLTRRKLTGGYRGVDARSRLQVEALTTFKAAITSDPLGALMNWNANDSDVCGWAGVVCSRKHSKHLIALNLGGAELVGNLNSALQKVGNLKFLNSLDLSRNSFSGSIPTASLANCSHLSALNFSHNQLSGNIPSQLGEIVKLQTLDFGGNNLTGEIPISLGNCTFLKFINLGSNFLEGAIPTVLGRLSRLQSLRLGKNSFTGSVPAALGNCSSLANLELFRNSNLGGELPRELGQLKSLQQLDLSTCNFQGALPTWMRNFTTLTVINLSCNHFDGHIPNWMGQLLNLGMLALGGNNFTGTIPISMIMNCTKLTIISVERNSLTGSIPFQIGFLRSLEILYLRGNSFTGVIPSAMANCSALQALLLGENIFLDPQAIPSWIGSFTDLHDLYLPDMNLQGAIPPEIGKLSNLRSLSLFSNNLTGVIPSSFAKCTLLRVLDLAKNKLAGSVPGDVISAMSSSLVSLNLSHNSFAGLWPPQLSELTNGQEIDVSGNNISGSIPNSIGSCKSLVRLDVSFNNLAGAIPQALASLATLSFFNASYNNFQGPIPRSLVFKTNLTETSFLGNPGLCGIILGPLQQCHNASPSTSESCHGLGCKHVWIPTICALLGAMIIGVLLRWMCTIHAPVKDPNSGHLEVLNRIMRFTGEDVLRIINEDGENNVIGVGARSVVYKGVLPGGGTIAIKVLRNSETNATEDGDDSRRVNELLQEVHTLAKLRHRNILKVLSFCSTADVKAIMLEYMPQGSLHKHLHELPGDACHLTWQNRFSIAMGVAEAMVHLHHEFPEPLIHRDLKPDNILLDENLEPKVSDFGLAKFARDGDPDGDPSSTFCGTFGYMPPEYTMGSIISTKGDVYSYGIVLMELLTRREPTCMVGLPPGKNLKDWVRGGFQERPFELLDSTLKEEGVRDSIKQEQMMLVMRVAIICTRETPPERPSMSEVLSLLSQIKDVGLVPPTTMQNLTNCDLTIVSSPYSDC